MKVCMLDPLFLPYFGGTEKVVLEVGSRLVRDHGYEIEVLTSMIPQARGIKREEIRGMRVNRTPSIYLERLPAFLPPPFTISPVLNWHLVLSHGGADVYHIHNRFWYTLGTLASVKMLLRRKLMLTIHNARPRGIARDVDFWGGFYDDTFGRLMFDACDRINCVSRAALDATVPEDLRGKCTVVYNGVDTKTFSPERGSEGVRESLGIHDSGPIIMSNGRLITQKAFSSLLEAFAGVKREFKDAHLVIVGKGPLKGELTRQASDLGIGGSFVITTGIPEERLPLFYNAADIFALPSLYEPSAVVLYEALACGKPIVATAVGGNREIVSEDCGRLVEPRDPKALENALLPLLRDDSLRSALGAASRRRAVERFDWDIIARDWDNSYRALF